ncbi:MAG: serine hydrolase, partial [Betaproteobacteria bacterium]|nr:serine hydrolase [Betaproteobacteria bacterium]
MRLIKQFAAAALLLVGGGTAAQQVTQPLSPAVAMPAARSTAISHPSPHMLESEDLTAWLDGFMPYAMRQGDIAGAVVTVVKDGQVIAAKGYGYADVAKRRPVDPARTLFRPGSVSKLITWTAVMQQVEAGKIDLDQDVNAYLDFRIPPYRGKPVTMRQIMTHSAGFADTVKNTFSYDAKTTPDLVTYMHMG